MKKSGLSLFEILVATMILATCLLGLANIFVAAKRKIAHSRYKMVAGELSKQWLEPLHSDVRQVSWLSTCLGNNVGCDTAVVNYDNVLFTPTFTFSDISISGRQVRKVSLTISWNEL